MIAFLLLSPYLLYVCNGNNSMVFHPTFSAKTLNKNGVSIWYSIPPKVVLLWPTTNANFPLHFISFLVLTNICCISQKYLYNSYVSRDGKEEADTYSARPGHSEHQTGLAFDLNSIDISFADTDEGKWVVDNCYKYGFIIRYPEGKDNITGYIYEPWHLRYVGVDLATKLYNQGDWITLEEYYGIDSKYS